MSKCTCEKWGCDDTCLCNCHRESEIDEAEFQVNLRAEIKEGI